MDTCIQSGDNTLQMQSAYAKSLQQTLKTRQDLVLDFTNLKACLDPLAEYANQNAESNGQEQQTQFEYKSFLGVYLNSKADEPFPQLASLTVRNLSLPFHSLLEEDESAEMMYSLMQFENLVEFDLSGVRIPAELQPQLQFWNLHNLKKLCMDSTGMKSMPSSVGRLRNLEVLSLNSNSLSDLPITLRFCQKLTVLNLKANQFHYIPGVVLKLTNLQELRRLDNPLRSRSELSSIPNSSAPLTQATAGIHSPGSLQSLCTRAMFTNHIDYWKQESLGPMQCKTLDHFASSLFLCDKCGTVISQEYKMDVMLFCYLGLRDVPIQLRACSPKCQQELVSHYTELNVALQRACDEEYENSIRLALEADGQSSQNLAISTAVGPFPTTNPHRRRRHRRCHIM